MQVQDRARWLEEAKEREKLDVSHMSNSPKYKSQMVTQPTPGGKGLPNISPSGATARDPGPSPQFLSSVISPRVPLASLVPVHGLNPAVHQKNIPKLIVEYCVNAWIVMYPCLNLNTVYLIKSILGNSNPPGLQS